MIEFKQSKYQMTLVKLKIRVAEKRAELENAGEMTPEAEEKHQVLEKLLELPGCFLDIPLEVAAGILDYLGYPVEAIFEMWSDLFNEAFLLRKNDIMAQDILTGKFPFPQQDDSE